MTTTINADNGAVSGSAGLKSSADATGVLALQTNGTTAVTVDASQRVGIGTASPATKLNISSAGADVEVRASTTTSGNVRFGFDADGAYYNWIQTNRSSGAIQFAISNSEVMRIDSSGKVGIGTSSPADKLDIVVSSSSTDPVFGGTSNNGIRLQNTNSTVGNFASILNVNSAGTLSSLIAFRNVDQNTPNTAGAIDFVTRNGGTLYRAMTVSQDGNLLVGTTSTIQSAIFTSLSAGNAGSFRTSASAAAGLCIDVSRTSATGDMVYFRTSSTTLAGYITCPTGTTTSYLSVSDYRLKENVKPMIGALEKISALKPCTYTWKADGVAGQGFIAHELQAVVPDCVGGIKDAVNEDGSIKPQGVDTSFLVATLTAAIQEQQALITQLQADVAALKGAPA